MFELSKTIARNTQTDPDDTAKTKFALTGLGYYDDSETGLSSYTDDRFFQSVQSFQKDNDLKTDGVIKPQGLTHTKMKEKLAEDRSSRNALVIFEKNRQDMIDADTIGADKYFHCKANYEASELGWGDTIDAYALSAGREIYGAFKGDGFEDIQEDGKANEHGRKTARSGKYKSARQACSIFRPKALDEKY